MSFLFINKTVQLHNLKTRIVMNAKVSVFVICIEEIIFLSLYNLHGCTFNGFMICLKRFNLIANGWQNGWQFLSYYLNLLLLYRKRCLHESQWKTLWLSLVNPRKDRSSRLQMFFKIGVLKDLRIFTGEHLCLNAVVSCEISQIFRSSVFYSFWKGSLKERA